MKHHRIRKIRNLRRSRRLSWLNRFRRNEQGVQLLELAIVLPIMLLLFAAVAEFGRYFYEYTTAAKGARVAARYLASKSVTSTKTDWKANAKNMVVYGNTAGTGSPILPGLTVANVDVQYLGGTLGIPDTVKVSIVNYEHDPLFDIGKLLKIDALSLAVDVKPSVTMRYLLTTPSV
ncbi:MAG: pilus assembly protein [Acidobacteria bacterium]|nr:pilus assembly protein [Acidobacteriota bacterium]